MLDCRKCMNAKVKPFRGEVTLLKFSSKKPILIDGTALVGDRKRTGAVRCVEGRWFKEDGSPKTISSVEYFEENAHTKEAEGCPHYDGPREPTDG